MRKRKHHFSPTQWERKTDRVTLVLGITGVLLFAAGIFGIALGGPPVWMFMVGALGALLALAGGTIGFWMTDRGP